jgi:aspartyl-tRNA(Asn)/glutamyl-tRNA(Gln) amidotransferase subunit B
MEKGDMRLEPNISLTLDVKKLPNYKVEVKNINSFKFVEKAINFEVIRQQELLEKGERPAQETRGWDSIRNKTFSQRSKEDAQDYRYFPEPDIPPIVMSKEQIEKLRKSLPELPDEKEKRFIKLGFSPYNAMVSTATVSRAEFIENTFNYAKEQNLDAMGTVNYALNRRINDIPNTTYKTIVEDYKKQSTVQTVDDSELEKIIKQVIEENEKAVTDYKSGKETVIMFLVGQVMKKVGKKIDAQMVKEKLQNALQK